MDVAIFLVRLLVSLLLYAFLGGLFWLLWRDLKTARRQEAVTPARERPGRLRVIEGGDSFQPDQLLALLPFTTLGRADSNTITINDPYASSEHAVIAWRGGQWWLEDRGSRNGTLLNALPLDEPLIIGQGDMISIGHVQFQFEHIDTPQVSEV